MMIEAEAIARTVGVRPAQAAATLELLGAGNTVPFIARYRKEHTGGMDEEQIRQISAESERLRALEERRVAILASIEEQGKLTPQLRERIAGAMTRTELEDLYQPYKQKRRTRASIARDRGLDALAQMMLEQLRTNRSAEDLAASFVGAEVPTVDDALAGARDIVAEIVSDHPDVRGALREKAQRWSFLQCDRIKDAADERGVYQTYYDFAMQVERLRSYQVLAINRGEAEKVLRVRVAVPERDWRGAIGAVFRPDRRSPFADQLVLALDDAAERLLLPAIERDVRRSLTERASTDAIAVFATNLRALLSQPPLAGHVVCGIDPGFRTGSKIAVVDATGKLLATTTIYPHPPQRQHDAARRTLLDLHARFGVTLITIGNGTAGRETEQFVAEILPEMPGVHYLIVNEAGASVYSASPLARAEFPDLDVSIRGAVSIARRAQDPLAELVKIDPQAIGVGLYQHDVDQGELGAMLGNVVESVVNRVGVDLNTASAALLTSVAGIGPKLADNIVEYRSTNGAFANRATLRKVRGLGPKAYEQAAGFLRVRDGDTPLDASAIHPESYPVARALLKRVRLTERSSLDERQRALDALKPSVPLPTLAAELGTGEPTLADIWEQLLRPGRDPRTDLAPPMLRSDVMSLDDLRTGLQLKGTVRNVVEFGVFVDIGVKQDGLLHRTQIPRGVVLNVGDIIDVTIERVEIDRGRIALGWAKRIRLALS